MGAAVLDPPADLIGPDALPAGSKLASASIRRVDGAPSVHDLDVKVPGAVLAGESVQLRELYRNLGADPASARVRELVDRGIAPIAGGATGLTGASFASNLPPEGQYVMDPSAFARETERNDMPLEQRNYPGLGGAPVDQRISNIGILSMMRVVFKGTLTVAGGGSVVSTYQWPWNVVKRLTLNLNGQTSLIGCEGLDLRARRQRQFRNPTEQVSTAPGMAAATGNPAPATIANGTYAVVLAYDVPIVHDTWSLLGAVFAQSDQTYLNYRVQPGAQAELFTVTGGSTVALTGSFQTTLTFYDIPMVDTQQGRRILIPDLRYLHGYIAGDQPFSNTGEVSVPFIRTSGQLTTYMAYIDNGGAAQIANTVPTEVRFQYGGNRRPRVHSPVETLLEENVQAYSGKIEPNYLVFDFESHNPEREVVYPKGVTELGMVATIPAGTTINPNARVHFVEETLFAGR